RHSVRGPHADRDRDLRLAARRTRPGSPRPPARPGDAVTDDFTSLPDLAVRTLGGSVVAASDESFAEKENLIHRWAPKFSPERFGPRGQEYDGWATARGRGPGPVWALVRLGRPGVIRGVVIGTAWFTGTYPPHASVEACAVDGYPSD